MYVKIIKGDCDTWYYDLADGIFEVKTQTSDYFVDTNDRYILRSDCEEITPDFDGKITEEFADKLANKIVALNCEVKPYNGSLIEARKEMIIQTIKEWKKYEYIKKSREDELKEEIKKLNNEVYTKNESILCNLYQELIQILDNKLKGE